MLFITSGEVLDKVEGLSSFVDHQSDGVGQIARVALLVPGLVDNLVIGVNL